MDRVLAREVCLKVLDWIDTVSAPHHETCFCDKEGLANQLAAALQLAEGKKQRKAVTKEFEARRLDLVQRTTEAARERLPAIFESFFTLHEELMPQLAALEESCCAAREVLVNEPMRHGHARIFYDGTRIRATATSGPSASPSAGWDS